MKNSNLLSKIYVNEQHTKEKLSDPCYTVYPKA